MKRIEKNDIHSPSCSVLDNAYPITYVPKAGSVAAHFTGADVEDYGFPLRNIVDLHPQRVMRATAANVMLSLQFPYGYTGAVALFNTNAMTTIISVVNTDPSNATYADGEEMYTEIVDLQGAATYQQLVSDRGKKEQTELFIEYPYVYTPHIVNVYLSGPIGVVSHRVEVGVVFAGTALETIDPSKGIKRTVKDYSVVSELATGATYTLKRDNVRVFNLSVDMSDCGDPQDLQKTFEEIGPKPIPWLITKEGAERWLVFARKNTEPSDNFYAYKRVRANLSLIEVL